MSLKESDNVNANLLKSAFKLKSQILKAQVIKQEIESDGAQSPTIDIVDHFNKENPNDDLDVLSENLCKLTDKLQILRSLYNTQNKEKLNVTQFDAEVPETVDFRNSAAVKIYFTNYLAKLTEQVTNLTVVYKTEETEENSKLIHKCIAKINKKIKSIETKSKYANDLSDTSFNTVTSINDRLKQLGKKISKLSQAYMKRYNLPESATETETEEKQRKRKSESNQTNSDSEVTKKKKRKNKDGNIENDIQDSTNESIHLDKQSPRKKKNKKEIYSTPSDALVTVKKEIIHISPKKKKHEDRLQTDIKEENIYSDREQSFSSKKRKHNNSNSSNNEETSMIMQNDSLPKRKKDNNFIENTNNEDNIQSNNEDTPRKKILSPKNKSQSPKKIKKDPTSDLDTSFISNPDDSFNRKKKKKNEESTKESSSSALNNGMDNLLDNLIKETKDKKTKEKPTIKTEPNTSEEHLDASSFLHLSLETSADLNATNINDTTMNDTNMNDTSMNNTNLNDTNLNDEEDDVYDDLLNQRNSIFDNEKLFNVHVLLEEAQDKNLISSEMKQKLKALEIVVTSKVPDSHKIETRLVVGPTRQQKEILKKYNIKYGPFTKEEDALIRSNWENFCKEYEFDDPKPFLNLQHEKEKFLPHRERVKFVQYLGQNLGHRMLSSIYRRFRILQENFRKGRFSKEEDELIITYAENVKKNEAKFAPLVRVLNRSRVALEARYKMLLASNSIHEFSEIKTTWDLELKEKLVRTLIKVTGSRGLQDLRDKELEHDIWMAVADKMNMPCLKVKVHWYMRLSTQLFAERPIIWDTLKVELILKLKEMGMDDWKTVNWQEVACHFPGFSGHFFWFILKSTVRRRVPPQFHTDLKKCLKYLDRYSMDDLKVRGPKSSRRSLYMQRLRYVNGKLEPIEEYLD